MPLTLLAPQVLYVMQCLFSVFFAARPLRSYIVRLLLWYLSNSVPVLFLNYWHIWEIPPPKKLTYALFDGYLMHLVEVFPPSINRKWASLQTQGHLCFSPSSPPCLCFSAIVQLPVENSFPAVHRTRRGRKLCLFVFELAWHGVGWGDILVWWHRLCVRHALSLCYATKMYYAPAPLLMSEQSGPWFIKQQHAFPTLRWREWKSLP